MMTYNCVRCGYEWASRKDPPPTRCARCKTTNYWRVRRVPAIQPDLGRAGRPPKFPEIVALAPGESIMVAWRELPRSDPRYTAWQGADKAYNASINPAAVQHARRHGWQVHTSAMPAGLRIERIA